MSERANSPDAVTIDHLNTGLVAVPDRTGGFHIYMTGGLYDPSRWLRGRLSGESWFASRADLEWAADGAGRLLRRHADYLQLAVKGEG